MPSRVVETEPKIEFLSPCSNCKNKFVDNEGCRAFKEIPMIILLGKNKHRIPLANQKNNIVFESKNNV